MFQFHNGSIKSDCEDYAPAFSQRFNSTMVRLKENTRLMATLGIIEFQFHNGSIKR